MEDLIDTSPQRLPTDAMECESLEICSNKLVTSKRTHEKIVKNGLGFLLQQMRTSNTAEKSESSQNTSEAIEVVEISNRKADEHAPEKKAPLSFSKIIYDFSDLHAKKPFQEIRDCFNAGTAPNFGFSKKVSENNYVRSCKWSPDGNWLLSDSEDRRARIFKFKSAEQKIDLHANIRSGDLIYEVQWHPTENLFASTSKDHPIHMWDTNGKVQSSFRGINNLDELSSAFSLAFSLDGQTIYGGYYKNIRLFNVERPGKQIKEIKTFEKESIGGQKAILSCFAMCPSLAGCYAVGSFAGSIGLYSDQTGKCDCLFTTESMGVTNLQYSSDGNYLFSGCRKSTLIECFDLRFPGMVLSKYYRPALTNQKISFQMDPFDRYLFSGSSSGDILVFDLKSGQKMDSIKEQPAIQATWRFKGSDATVSGLSLHPEFPIIVVSTGQRVFPAPFDPSSSDDDADLIENADESSNTLYTSMKKGLDNSLKLYKF